MSAQGKHWRVPRAIVPPWVSDRTTIFGRAHRAADKKTTTEADPNRNEFSPSGLNVYTA